MLALAPKCQVESPLELTGGSRQVDGPCLPKNPCAFFIPFFHGTSLSSALTPGWAALLENNADVQREISEQKLRSVSVQIK